MAERLRRLRWILLLTVLVVGGGCGDAAGDADVAGVSDVGGPDTASETAGADGSPTDAVPDSASDVPPLTDVPPPTGLTAPVEIRIDDHGMPHLYAATDEDLFFAAGYQIAVDRLFAVDMFRRRATGRRAEVLGEAGLLSDRMVRTLGFRDVAPRSVALLAEVRPRDHRLLQAYVAGLNRRVDEVLSGVAPLPEPYGADAWDFAPERFTEEDVLALGTMVVFGFASTVEVEILASIMNRMVPEMDEFPAYDPGLPVFILESGLDTPAGATKARAAQSADAGARARSDAAPVDLSPADLSVEDLSVEDLSVEDLSVEDRAALRGLFEAFRDLRPVLRTGGGSNSWVVAARHTENGRPYLLSDPHVGYADPNDLYMVHLNSADQGGAFDVVGFSFPGVPGVQLGHNGRLAWSATVNFADVVDIWDVKVTPEGAHLGGEVVPVVSRTETIRVRQEDGTFREDPFKVRTVPGRGVFLPSSILPVPTMLFAKGEALVNWVGFEPTDELILYGDLDRAADLEEFEAAIGHQKNGLMNWTGATAEGWRYKVHGLVPDRGPLEGRPRAYFVLDGADPRTLWTGEWLPDDQLPYVGDDRSYLVTANNDPWGHCRDGEPANDDFYYGTYYLPGYRAARIEQRLDELIAAGPVTLEDMQALQMDAHSTLADQLLPLLAEALDALDTAAGDEALAEFRDRADLRAAAERLLAWDRDAVRGSAEAALYRIWYAFLSRRTLADEMTLLFEGLDAAQPIILGRMVANVLTRDVQAFEDDPRAVLVLSALADAVAEVERRGGASLTWGDIQESVFLAPDGSVGTHVAKDGDDSAVNVNQCAFWKDGALLERGVSSVGTVFRMAYTFDEDGTPRAWFNMPTGNAGTTEEWIEGDYRPVRFRRADVEAHSVDVRSLVPAE